MRWVRWVGCARVARVAEVEDEGETTGELTRLMVVLQAHPLPTHPSIHLAPLDCHSFSAFPLEAIYPSRLI